MSPTRRPNQPARPNDHPTAPNESRDVPAVHTLEEAAAILRVRRSWLERQAAARKIPFTMLGGAYHFTSNHLLTIVRIHEVAPCGQDEAADAPIPASRPTRTARPQARPQGIEPLRARPRTGPRRAA